MMITTERSLKPDVSILRMKENEGRKTQNGRYLWIHRKCLSSDEAKTHTSTAPHTHTHTHLHCRVCVVLFLAVFFKRESNPAVTQQLLSQYNAFLVSHPYLPWPFVPVMIQQTIGLTIGFLSSLGFIQRTKNG